MATIRSTKDNDHSSVEVLVDGLTVADIDLMMGLMRSLQVGRGSGEPYHSLYVKLEEAIEYDDTLGYYPHEYILAWEMQDAVNSMRPEDEHEGRASDEDVSKALATVNTSKLVDILLTDDWHWQFWDVMDDALKEAQRA